MTNTGWKEPSIDTTREGHSPIVEAGIAKLNIYAKEGYPMTCREAGALADALTKQLAAHDALVAALRDVVRAWDATQFPVSGHMEAALTEADRVLADIDQAEAGS